MDELTKRNFHAMSEGLKAQRDETDILKEELKKRDAIIGQLMERLNGMEQRLAVVFAKSMGAGSTS